MQCTNCGFAISPEDNVCSNCGHILKSSFKRPGDPHPGSTSNRQPIAPQAAKPSTGSSPPPVIPAPQFQPAPEHAAHGVPKKKKRLGCLVAVGLLVSGLCIFAVWFWNNGTLFVPSSSSSSTSSSSNSSSFDSVATQQAATADAKSENFEIWTDYVRATDEILTRWDAAYSQAQGANRIELPGIIDQLVEVRSSLALIQVDSRYNPLHQKLLDAFYAGIAGLDDWHAGGSEYEDLAFQYREYRAQWLQMLNQIEH
jgi:hypothetical protein